MPYYLDMKITLHPTEPEVWRRVLLPNYASLNDLLDTIQDAFAWDGAGRWEALIEDHVTLHDHLIAQPLTLHYWLDESCWTHEITCLDPGVERDDAPSCVYLEGDHVAPYDDIIAPARFAHLMQLKARHDAGEVITDDQMPPGYLAQELDAMSYDADDVRAQVERDAEFDTSLSQSFQSFLAQRWPDEMPERATKLALFPDIERGCQRLGLSREQVLVSYGYWGLVLEEDVPGMYTHPSPVIAATLVKLIDDTQLEQEAPEKDVPHLTLPELYAAFGIAPSAQPQVVALLDVMLPFVQAIDMGEAATVALDVHNASFGGVDDVDDLSARQRAALMWQEPMGAEMLEWSAQRDFIMYVACERFDPTQAPEDEDPPDYLFVATDEVQDQALAVLPWYGELSDAQRHDALFRTILVACAIPSFGEPSRPIGIVLPTDADARGVEALFPFEDIPVMGMDALAATMRKESARKASTRRKTSGKSKSAQKKARKKNRKKK